LTFIRSPSPQLRYRNHSPSRRSLLPLCRLFRLADCQYRVQLDSIRRDALLPVDFVEESDSGDGDAQRPPQRSVLRFGWARLASARLRAPMLIHMTINLCGFGLILARALR
jgi:hypothetical protein